MGGAAAAVLAWTLPAAAEEPVIDIPAPTKAVMIPGTVTDSDAPATPEVAAIKRAAIAESARTAVGGTPITDPTLTLSAPHGPAKPTATARLDEGGRPYRPAPRPQPKPEPVLLSALDFGPSISQVVPGPGGQPQVVPAPQARTLPPGASPNDPIPVGPNGEPDPAAIKRAYDAAFQQVLRDPANLDKAYRFAELAVLVGDLEGAITALERMLLINPDLPRVRLELGVLYYRLGSFEVARTYLQQALANPDLPEKVRGRAEQFLTAVQDKMNPSKFTGTIYTGLRYQSNANAAPSDAGVLVGGFPATLNQNGTAAKDWNAFIIGTAHHSYDLHTQYPDTIDTQAFLYSARQYKRSDVNLTYFSVHSGPRTWMMEDTWAKPYIGFDYAMLDDRTDYWSPTAGVTVERRLTGGDDAPGALTLIADWARRNYVNNSAKPYNSDRTGDSWELRAFADYPLDKHFSVQGGAGYVWYYANAGYETYRELTVTGGATVNFAAPIGNDKRSWFVSLLVSRVLANYRDPDPTIDPTTRRHDRDWRASASLTAPLDDDWAVIGSLARNERKSSLPNYEYLNYIGMLGIARHF